VAASASGVCAFLAAVALSRSGNGTARRLARRRAPRGRAPAGFDAASCSSLGVCGDRNPDAASRNLTKRSEGDKTTAARL